MKEICGYCGFEAHSEVEMNEHLKARHYCIDSALTALDMQIREHVLRNGIEAQIIQVGEELAELFKAISKLYRRKCHPFQVAKEVADVLFMIEQIPIITEQLTNKIVTPNNFRAWVDSHKRELHRNVLGIGK